MAKTTTMVTWLKRGLLCFWLLALAIFAVLYFWSVSIVEAILLPKLEARGGQLELGAIRLRLSGVELELERYEEAGLLVEGLTLVCPWNQLGSISDGFGGQLSIVELRVRPDVFAGPDKPGYPQSAAERVAAVAARIDGLPLRGAEVAVRNLFIETTEGVFRYEANCSLFRSNGGETHLTGALEGSHLSLEVRVKVLAGGEGLALDFVGSANDWAGFRAKYLSTLSARLSDVQMEFYLDPLREGGGFLDLSGYTRWAATQADELSFTLLADLGSSELYFSSGECIMPAASLGLAGSGAGMIRVYAKGAVESLRYGSWVRSGGDWALRVDGDHLAGELRLGEGLSVSLGLEDWRRALGGTGRGQVYFEADAVNAAWLRVFPIEGIPDDLELGMGLKLEGRGTFKNFRVDKATAEADFEIRQAVWPSKGLILRDLQGQAQAGVAGGNFELKSLELRMAELLLSGIAISDVDFAAKGQGDGTFTTSPIRADFMGGGLRIEAATVDSANLEDLSIHASMDSVELAQLAEAVPQFKGEIQGAASGYLVVAWREGQAILTDGQLEVDPETGARLKYDVDGLLTRGMSPDSSAYKQYRMAEKAFADLALKRFRVDIFPEGNRTRPFRLELFGESVQEGTVVPVDFNLNVNVDDTAGLLEILRLMRQGQLDLN